MRRSIYEALGGFRPMPLFEDYELLHRLERVGRTAYIRHVTVTASARRFEGAALRSLLVWSTLQVLYSAGVSAERLAGLYHDRRPGPG